MRGEKALSYGYLNHAIHDFSRAIELDPSSSLPYLERGVAHFGLGEYDRSLEDFYQYTSQTPKNDLCIPDFSLGFAKGLPKGIYESGEGFFLFLSDLVSHPVHTGEQMWEALTLLSSLVRSEQWSAISEVLAPEVHQLVKEWDSLPSDVRGELAGYAFGKHGADIIIPGALAKAASLGIKGAEKLNLVSKIFQTGEKTLLLESVASLESPAVIGEFIQTSQQTAILAEDLGFSVREMGQLKQAGKLEETVANVFESVANNPEALESSKLFERAEEVLHPKERKFMPEMEVRENIHEAGVRTFPRPMGIPDNFRVKLSKKSGGMEYVHPTNVHTRVRVMPGNPYSENPCQQKPYVIQKVDGMALDRYGNFVSTDAPEAHIPLEEFVYIDK
jgi:tetratricopeptide (TPR) repeat protein